MALDSPIPHPELCGCWPPHCSPRRAQRFQPSHKEGALAKWSTHPPSAHTEAWMEPGVQGRALIDRLARRPLLRV